jgi:hypothetical protein
LGKTVRKKPKNGVGKWWQKIHSHSSVATHMNGRTGGGSGGGRERGWKLPSKRQQGSMVKLPMENWYFRKKEDGVTWRRLELDRTWKDTFESVVGMFWILGIWMAVAILTIMVGTQGNGEAKDKFFLSSAISGMESKKSLHEQT